MGSNSTSLLHTPKSCRPSVGCYRSALIRITVLIFINVFQIWSVFIIIVIVDFSHVAHWKWAYNLVYMDKRLPIKWITYIFTYSRMEHLQMHGVINKLCLSTNVPGWISLHEILPGSHTGKWVKSNHFALPLVVIVLHFLHTSVDFSRDLFS